LGLSPLTKRRLAIVRSRKPAMLSIVFLAIMGIAALGAEALTNSKPLIGKLNGKVIFPAYVDYNREDMGLVGAGVVDYRELKESFEWAWWPILDWDPFENDLELEVIISAPDSRHIMGTDVAGRDVFARLIYGTRVSFLFAISLWILTDLIGTVVGMVQGYFGGRIDLFGQRFTEVFSSIPTFYLLLLLITVLSPDVSVLIGLSAIFGWVGISLYLRAEALRNKSLPFCEAARALGATSPRIIFRHILPNSLVPLVTFAPFTIVGGILTLAGLDLLGFGVPPPTPSWGELLDQARKNFQVAWWLAVYPSLFLFLSIVTLNLIGEALRAAFDPRAKL
jgi:microcin C transport system permease protein